ncbi:MAG: preprotein translocase subunit SecG, partial [Proteobacteria bacterium]|nr:preprotein translocase subunit SecG [Pseudomonadota bacterium]
MLTFIYVCFTIVCVFLVITVLLQPGKSGGLGAAFGGGGNTVFGASGGTPIFRRMTTIAAVLFMLLSLLLAYKSLDTSVTTTDNQKKRGLENVEFNAQDLLELPNSAPAAAAAPAAAPAPVPAPAPAAAPV